VGIGRAFLTRSTTDEFVSLRLQRFDMRFEAFRNMEILTSTKSLGSELFVALAF